MKRLFLSLVFSFSYFLVFTAFAQYTPTPENLQRRQEFEGFRFGIFLHWGIYSTYA